MIDHDRLFKALLTTFFADFVELFLPDVDQYLDKDSIVFMEKELFTDVTAGERHEADLVVKARFKGEDAFFLIHVEHQAQVQADFGRRMFRYFARLHEKYQYPVFPVVIFSHDRKRAEPDHYKVTFSGHRVLDFHYRVIQLKRLSWREYLKRPNPAACALMSKMDIAPVDRVYVKAECLRILVTLKLDPARKSLISDSFSLDSIPPSHSLQESSPSAARI